MSFNYYMRHKRRNKKIGGELTKVIGKQSICAWWKIDPYVNKYFYNQNKEFEVILFGVIIKGNNIHKVKKIKNCDSHNDGSNLLNNASIKWC